MLQKAVYALNDNQLFLNFILLKMYRKQYHCAQFYAYQINKKTRLFPCKMSTYTRMREEVAKWFDNDVGSKNIRLYCLYWLAHLLVDPEFTL